MKPKRELGMVLIFLALLLAYSVLEFTQQGSWPTTFYSGANLHSLSQVIGFFGIFGVGMAIVIITGGIDLSLGSMTALLGVILGQMLASEMNWVVAVLITLLIAAVLGAIHGILITRANLQPFVVTLCGLLIYRGAARFSSHDSTVDFGGLSAEVNPLRSLAVGDLFGIPASFVALILICIVIGLLLHRSVFGRYLFAIGRNEEAARYSGINTKLVILTGYILTALLTGIGTIFLSFYSNSVSPSIHGNFYELYAVAAAVLGGCSLRGGEGGVLGVLIGTMLIQMLRTIVTLQGIDSSLEFVVMGGVILAAVLVDQFLAARRRARESRIDIKAAPAATATEAAAPAAK